MVGALEQLIFRQPPRLLNLLLATVVASAVTCIVLLTVYGSATLTAVADTALTIGAGGGFVFGLGAAFNEGCAFSTLNRFARGDLRMIGTLLGLPLGALLVFGGVPGTDAGHLEPLFNVQTLAVCAAVAFSILLLSRHGRADPHAGHGQDAAETRTQAWPLSVTREIVPMVALGATGALLFASRGGWTYVETLGSSAIALAGLGSMPDMWTWLVTIAAFAGATLAALFNGIHKPVQSYRFVVFLLHLLAGFLMGAGAAIAGGGNDSVLLYSVPRGSLHGALTAFGIVLGIGAGLLLGRWSIGRPRPEPLPKGRVSHDDDSES